MDFRAFVLMACTGRNKSSSSRDTSEGVVGMEEEEEEQRGHQGVQ